MVEELQLNEFSRRAFLTSAGALVVAIATPAVVMSIPVGVGASAELNSGNFVTVAQVQNALIQGARNVSVL